MRELKYLNHYLEQTKNQVRKLIQDDMLVHWSDSKFLLVYLVDDESNAAQVLHKIQELTNEKSVSGLRYKFTFASQGENETISKLIKRV